MTTIYGLYFIHYPNYDLQVMLGICVDQQKGALFTVFEFKQVFPSLTEEKKEKRKETLTRTCIKRGVYQRLSVTLKRWLTPKNWSTLGANQLQLFM